MLWVFIVTIAAMPAVVCIFLCYNSKKLAEDKFEKRYGALYSGLNVKKRSVLLYTPLFMLRRILFALVVCYLHGYIWVQLAFQIFCTLSFSSYLLAFKPLNSKK